MPQNQGPVSPLSGGKGRPVPGGKSQAGRKANGGPNGRVLSSVNVGRGRGLLGNNATADALGRTPAQQKRGSSGVGNSYAGVLRPSGGR